MKLLMRRKRGVCLQSSGNVKFDVSDRQCHRGNRLRAMNQHKNGSKVKNLKIHCYYFAFTPMCTCTYL